MCGRYTLTSADDLLAQLALVGGLGDWVGTHNAAPGQRLPCVINRGPQVCWLRWGLAGSWSDTSAFGRRLINARSETAAHKPAFRDAYARRRCLVPADGFYEWRRDGDTKTPFYFRRRDRRAFAFAGLWQASEPEGDGSGGFAIATTAATGPVASVHDRMPVIVSPSDYSRWLRPEPPEATALQDMATRSSCDAFESFEVSIRVNNVRNDGPELIEPGPQQLGLF